MSDDYPIVKGQQWLAPTMGVRFTVTRVAKDDSWADVVVVSPSATWRKRQPLRDGWFPFGVTRIHPARIKAEEDAARELWIREHVEYADSLSISDAKFLLEQLDQAFEWGEQR